MWVMTKTGFYSTVEDRANPDVLIVRCRVREDMEATGWPYAETPDADYAFRAMVPRANWAAFIAAETVTINYDNFKDSLTDPVRHEVYMNVWLELLALNPRGWGKYKFLYQPEVLAEFTIPLAGCTLVTPNSRLHWRAKAKLVKDFRQLAYRSASPKRIPTGEHRYIDLTLVRGKGQRLLDPDAIPYACKPLLDGIVDAGLLYDDAEKWCTSTYSQIKDAKPELRVRVEA